MFGSAFPPCAAWWTAKSCIWKASASISVARQSQSVRMSCTSLCSVGSTPL